MTVCHLPPRRPMPTPWRPPGAPLLAPLQIQLTVAGGVLEETVASWPPCYRIIGSEYAGQNLFDRLVGGGSYPTQAVEAELLAQIADLSNPHVLAEMGQIDLVLPSDRVYGPGNGLIMAAFAFPGAPSRFSDGSAGTYYAARTLGTAIAETRCHAEHYLRGEAACVLEKTVIEAELDGTFLDVRRPRPAPTGIYDLNDYTAGQAFGAMVRQLEGFGILYDSVRDAGSECVAVMRPPVLSGATAVRTLEYHWDGHQIERVR